MMNRKQNEEYEILKNEIAAAEREVGEIKAELLRMEARRDELERRFVPAKVLPLKREFIARISEEIDDKYGAMNRIEGGLESMRYLVEVIEREALV